MKTYNIELILDDKNKQFWIDLLSSQHDCVNYIAQKVFCNKNKIGLKIIHDKVYYDCKKLFPSLSSQMIIKSEQEVLRLFRSLRSNKHFNTIPKKSGLCMRLDKHLYSHLTQKSINLCSNVKYKRLCVKFKLYPMFTNMSSKYKMLDPLIFSRNNKLYLSISFMTPLLAPTNNDCLGIDLGLKRLATTSEGKAFACNDYKCKKRQIRYLKRIYQHKKAYQKLKRLKRKEANFSKNYIHHLCNKLLDTDKSFIILEDLTGIKKRTRNNLSGFNNKRHNNALGQIPFCMIKTILQYKALHVGKQVETVNPSYTSQLNCLTGKKDGVRKGCRYITSNEILDADWNAACNIAKRSKHLCSFNSPLDGKLNLQSRLLSTNQTCKNLKIKKSRKPDFL